MKSIELKKKNVASSDAASQHQGPGFHCKFTVYVDPCSHGFLLDSPVSSQFPKTRWTDYAKLPVGITECEYVCVVLCNGLASHPSCFAPTVPGISKDKAFTEEECLNKGLSKRQTKSGTTKQRRQFCATDRRKTEEPSRMNKVLHLI